MRSLDGFGSSSCKNPTSRYPKKNGIFMFKKLLIICTPVYRLNKATSRSISPRGQNVKAKSANYQFLQLQYLAFHFGPGLSQLCLALKLFLRSGMFFLIVMFGSPKLTLTTLPFSFLVYTENFFGPLGVLNGLLRVTVLP